MSVFGDKPELFISFPSTKNIIKGLKKNSKPGTYVSPSKSFHKFSLQKIFFELYPLLRTDNIICLETSSNDMKLFIFYVSNTASKF